MDEDLRKRAQTEERKIKKILKDSGVSQANIKLLGSIIKNSAWMQVKLDDAMELIKNSSIAMPYNNGGGQKGIRENPLFRGYEALWKSYMAGMDKIISMLPEEKRNMENSGKSPSTVLELVRKKHGKVAGQ